MKQKTKEWLEARSGVFTASEIYRLMGVKGLNESGESYAKEKAWEELGGAKREITNMSMEWGNEHEPIAREQYELATGHKVSEFGFLIHEDYKYLGCSPDGIVGTSHGIEIKCPETGLAFVNLALYPDELKKIKPEYYWQIQCCMLVCGLDRWDFIVYDPRLMENGILVIHEHKADKQAQSLIIERYLKALEIKNNVLKRFNL